MKYNTYVEKYYTFLSHYIFRNMKYGNSKYLKKQNISVISETPLVLHSSLWPSKDNCSSVFKSNG